MVNRSVFAGPRGPVPGTSPVPYDGDGFFLKCCWGGLIGGMRIAVFHPEVMMAVTALQLVCTYLWPEMGVGSRGRDFCSAQCWQRPLPFARAQSVGCIYSNPFFFGASLGICLALLATHGPFGPNDQPERLRPRTGKWERCFSPRRDDARKTDHGHHYDIRDFDARLSKSPVRSCCAFLGLSNSKLPLSSSINSLIYLMVCLAAVKWCRGLPSTAKLSDCTFVLIDETRSADRVPTARFV